MNYAIIVAGGKGKRFSSKEKKQFFKIGSKTILDLTVEKFLNHNLIDRIVVVISEEDRYKFNINDDKIYKISLPGEERKDSVLNALNTIKNDINENDNILIHDGVRPFVSENLITKILNALNDYDCVVPGIKIFDTVKEIDNENFIKKTLNRDKLIRIQTPQGFKGKLLNILIGNLKKPINFTDEASVFEFSGEKVKVIPGEEKNLKITTKEDIMKFYSSSFTGFGYDVHKFCKGRELYLGGIKIEYDYGLEGHSDADVLLHSIIDAILGAAGYGDIGELFPDTDNKYKDIRSTKLLKIVAEKINNDFLINNIDSTIVCEKPKLKNYKNLMREKLSEILNIPVENINIKATTTEGLGFTGRNEGIASYSVVTLVKIL